MVKLYFLLSLLLLPYASFSNKPGNTVNKPKSSIGSKASVELISASGRSFILRNRNSSNRPISFMVTDSRGVVVMFGDNYSSGSILNFSHFQSGNYTMYFDKDTNSAAAYFTVAR